MEMSIGEEKFSYPVPSQSQCLAGERALRGSTTALERDFLLRCLVLGHLL
jgi:hypothetical protein